jgi:hypothetical protein
VQVSALNQSAPLQDPEVAITSGSCPYFILFYSHLLNIHLKQLCLLWSGVKPPSPRQIAQKTAETLLNIDARQLLTVRFSSDFSFVIYMCYMFKK